MAMWPYVSPPRVTLSMLPAYLPPKPPGFVTTRISCVPCGQRCDPDVEDVAMFLLRHEVHIREFLERVEGWSR